MLKIQALSVLVLLHFVSILYAADSAHICRMRKNIFSDGEVKSAVIELKNALQEDPANTEARLILGQIHLQLGDGPSAEKELKRAARLRVSGKTLAGETLSQAYLLQRKYDELLEDIEPDPTLSGEVLAAVWTLGGQALLGKRQLEQARGAFEQVLVEAPDNQEAEVGLIRIALALGNRDEGKKKLDRLLEQYPNNLSALILRGELARQSNQLEQALADFNQALALQPGNLQVLLARAAIHLSQRAFSLAEQDLDSLEKTAPGSPIVLYLRAVSAFQQRNLEQAEKDIQQVLGCCPITPRAS